MAQLTNQAQAIPSDLATQRTGRTNLKFIVGGFLLIAVVIALIVQATMSTGAYYLTVNEVRSGAANLVGQRVRVSGVTLGARNTVPLTESRGLQRVDREHPVPGRVKRASGCLADPSRCARHDRHGPTLLLPTS